MAWLSYKCQAEQDTVIAFSIREAQRAKMFCKQHKAHIANIQQKHHVGEKPKVLEGNLRKHLGSFLKERRICIMSFPIKLEIKHIKYQKLFLAMHHT